MWQLIKSMIPAMVIALVADISGLIPIWLVQGLFVTVLMAIVLYFLIDVLFLKGLKQGITTKAKNFWDKISVDSKLIDLRSNMFASTLASVLLALFIGNVVILTFVSFVMLITWWQYFWYLVDTYYSDFESL